MKKQFRFISFAFLFLVSAYTHAQLTINIADLGAVGNGISLNTTIIQKAIDSVSALGGGTVLISGGKFLSSTIVLKSNVTLRINAGDTLLAVSTNADYPDYPYSTPSWNDTYTRKSLIFAQGASNIRITGGGMINCSGLSSTYLSISKNYRPFGVRINDCVGVQIDSVYFLTSPQWMIHVSKSKDVVIRGIDIYNHGFGSNDGIDIDACENVLIEDNNIDSNDDPIAIKTHSEVVCRNVLVQNCTVATFERGVKVGNESQGPLRNIRFQNITIKKSKFGLTVLPQTAIYVAVADGGDADSILFDNINVLTPYQTAIFIRLCDRGLNYNAGQPKPPVKFLRNVTIQNVTAEAGSNIPISITGIPNYLAENITLRNVFITVPGAGTATTGNIPELETRRPENDIWGDSLPAYGLYLRHVKDIYLDSFCVTTKLPDVRPFLVSFNASNVQGDNCTNVISGVKNMDAALSTIIFPNPAKQQLYIQNIIAGVNQIKLYNVQGSLIKQIDTENQTNLTIDLSSIAKGLYFVGIGEKYSRLVIE